MRSKIFFKKIRSNECFEEEYDAISFIDSCFEEVKFFVEQSACILGDSRMLFRSSNKEEALELFFSFQKLCFDFLSSIDEVKVIIENVSQGGKYDKLFLSMQEVISKSTQRKIKTKIPTPDIDYLKTEVIADFDVDWILQKIRNFWGKFLQVYGSLRINIVVKER